MIICNSCSFIVFMVIGYAIASFFTLIKIEPNTCKCANTETPFLLTFAFSHLQSHSLSFITWLSVCFFIFQFCRLLNAFKYTQVVPNTAPRIFIPVRNTRLNDSHMHRRIWTKCMNVFIRFHRLFHFFAKSIQFAQCKLNSQKCISILQGKFKS